MGIMNDLAAGAA